MKNLKYFRKLYDYRMWFRLLGAMSLDTPRNSKPSRRAEATSKLKSNVGTI